ncbi:hypothetical protein NQ315_009350 [Exocentrus adspersus]|uniref:Chitin-binding type-2 domain-containing protein n=1 Tax=Exocentrus adspersus TaxID=1586481 RepID=A0AAV8WID5_9CUCU|nr:hypothetical protein NQ315_009350 [Exocentrus adspersus]
MKGFIFIFGTFAVFASALAVDCPEEDENSHATYFPHETECGKFYECHNGESVILECPPGLYWDAKVNVCNWDVNCGTLRTSTAPPSTTSSEAPPPTTSEAPTPTDAPATTSEAPEPTTVLPETTATEEIQCPATVGEEAVYLPHETECGKFYECSSRKAMLFECPPGTYFDVRVNTCNWNVDCGNLATSTPPPPTTPTAPPAETTQQE